MKRLSFFNDRTVLSQKIKESFSSVLPVAVIVILIMFTFVPVESGILLSFLAGVLCVILGTGLFSLGADNAMSKIGTYVGTSILKSKKLFLILPLYFLVGLLITVSEPDLMVYADQLSETINKWTLIIVIGVGVGVFLMLAFLRTILKVKLSYMLVFLYVVILVLSFFIPKNFIPLAFDAGGVITGPMTVPFILAIGTGIASIRSDKDAESDGFGLTALCCMGPIIAVMILGIIFNPEEITVTETELLPTEQSTTFLKSLLSMFPTYIKQVAVALLPVIALFFITMIFGEKIPKFSFIKIIIGIVYTFVGLVLFLVGVDFGFFPIGETIGEALGQKSYSFIIIPIAMLLGFFVVGAEPAVNVLTEQVSKITLGTIPKKALKVSLMIGTAISVGLAMTRILLNIPILYFLIPCYVIAIVLTFIVPDIFVSIAFDSGGVASGAIATGFLLPLALGLCKSVNADLMVKLGFGMIAFISVTPLITIQILGLIYKIKIERINKREKSQTVKEEIIS